VDPGVTRDNRGSSRTLIPQLVDYPASSAEMRSVAYNDDITPELPRRVRGLPTSRWSTWDGPHPTISVGANGASLYWVASWPCH
jgi:hypothetical protein